MINNNSVERSTTPKVNRNVNPPMVQQQSKRTPPGNSSSNMANTSESITSTNQLLHNIAQASHQSEHLQNIHHMQQFGQLGPLSQHTHNQNLHQTDYLSISQIGQNYAHNTFENVSMPTVIQQRISTSAASAQHPLSSPHQKLGPSPSSCAVNNYYLQSNLSAQSDLIPNSTQMSSNLSPSSANIGVNITSSAGTPASNSVNDVNGSHIPHTQGNISTSLSSSSPVSSGPSSSIVGSLCSLSKLQQLTNGLEVQSCNANSVGQSTLTSPPHPQPTMPTPPHLLVNQNRSMGTPPNMIQSSPIPYHKYYSSNVNIAPSIPTLSQNTNRTHRNVPLPSTQHVSVSSVATTSTLNRNTNVSSLSPNIMTPYGAINSYRMSSQQSAATAGYIAANTAAAAGFSNAQIPVQMGVMNMQSQYQDPGAIRAAQQNSMYSTYSPYIPLNGHMRR